MTATSYAHRITLPQDDGLALILSLGATAADLCADDLGDDGHPPAPCLACQISGSADLPGHVGMLVALDHACHLPLIAPGETLVLTRVQGLANRPQGPPSA